jgi:hypothetical protein
MNVTNSHKVAGDLLHPTAINNLASVKRES